MKQGSAKNLSLKEIVNSLVESKKYEMFRNGTNMEFRKKSDNGLVGSVSMNEKGQLPDSGYFKLAAGPLKSFKSKIELNDLVNGLIRESIIVTEGEAKISKGNKSSKNSFGEDELKTPWATGKKDDCCEDYGISAEDAEKKIKDIKSLDKLDEEYQRLFLQMDNEMDRYWFRRCYQELRNKIGQKEVPKPTVTNKNFDK